MKPVAAIAAAFVTAALLGPGSTVSAQQRTAPVFKPERFFLGATRSDGAFVDDSGRPEQRVVGETRGFRDRDGATVFDQTIRFADGTTRVRRWRLVRDGTHVTAQATDVVGAVQGEIEGRRLRLSYTLRTDPDNPLLDVDFDQEFELRPDGTLSNRSTIRKFGFVVRRLDETFVRGRASATRP